MVRLIRGRNKGIESLHEQLEKYKITGIKLYTAEWKGTKGYKLSDKESYRFLEEGQKLGIKNIHVQKDRPSSRSIATLLTWPTSTDSAASSSKD